MSMHLHTGVGSFLRSRTGLVLLGFLAVAAFFLATEHTAHFFGALPFILLLACPLMMFMHGGHRGQVDEHAGHGAEHSTGGTER